MLGADYVRGMNGHTSSPVVGTVTATGSPGPGPENASNSSAQLLWASVSFFWELRFLNILELGAKTQESAAGSWLFEALSSAVWVISIFYVAEPWNQGREKGRNRVWKGDSALARAIAKGKAES